jgi:hypothetical protein
VASLPLRTCASCGRSIESEYCPVCGEQAIKPDDLTLRRLLMDIFRSITDFDSRLLRSFRRLMFSPGALTAAYLEGPRKPFIAPFPLFLLANVAFFAIQSISGEKIFSSPLESHLHHQDWSALAQRLVADRLASASLSFEAYAPVFDQAVTVNAKSLVIIMTVPFALVLIAMFRGSGRPFATHCVFALHFYAFQLLLFCFVLSLMIVNDWFGGPDAKAAIVDVGVFVTLLVVSALYLYSATGRVYESRGLLRAGKVLVLTFAVGVGVLGYRFLVFLFTLYTT